MDVAAFIRGRMLWWRSRRLSREAFEHERLVRFREFAEYVQRKSHWYCRIMREREIDPRSCHPGQFPVLTKKEVIEHFDEIVTDRDVNRRDLEAFLHRSQDPRELFRGRYTAVHTSGSSGEVGYFIYDQAAWSRLLSQIKTSEGFRLTSSGRQRIAFVGATQGHFSGVSISTACNVFPLNLIFKTKSFEVNRPLADTVRGLNEFQPSRLVGYGTVLRALAEQQLMSELRISPKVVANSGEPLLDSDRAVMEHAFGKCIRNTYSCSEFGPIAHRESSWRHMQLLETYLIVEIASDHTLVTSLSNRVLPLIRYRMNDVLTLVPSDEHAPFRAISDVLGRVEQLANFRNRHGTVDGISPHTINEILIPHVRRFQMRLRGPESFEFAVIFAPSATSEQRVEALSFAKEKLKAILIEKDMDNVAFDVRQVDDIPVDLKSGKFRLIVPAPSAAGEGSAELPGAAKANSPDPAEYEGLVHRG
jgi:phenylacetate-CoA ligase